MDGWMAGGGREGGKGGRKGGREEEVCSDGGGSGWAWTKGGRKEGS